MVECHLLGMCRALVAQERKKVKRNPREIACVCTRILNFPETLPQPAGEEQPTPRLADPATLQNARWKRPLAPTNSQTTRENFWGESQWIQAKSMPGTLLMVWMYQQWGLSSSSQCLWMFPGTNQFVSVDTVFA